MKNKTNIINGFLKNWPSTSNNAFFSFCYIKVRKTIYVPIRTHILLHVKRDITNPSTLDLMSLQHFRFKIQEAGVELKGFTAPDVNQHWTFTFFSLENVMNSLIKCMFMWNASVFSVVQFSGNVKYGCSFEIRIYLNLSVFMVGNNNNIDR